MTTRKKERVDRRGIPLAAKKAFEESPPDKKIEKSGIAGFDSLEARPVYDQLDYEEIVAGSYASHIVFGRDRPGSTQGGYPADQEGRERGYGGEGATQCSAIDIVAGVGGAEPRQVNGLNKEVKTGPDFFVDSARIYISQKTDIDNNFELATGSVGNSEGKSAIAVKADGVRVIGREGIKLITTTDGLNSQQGPIEAIAHGIDLIAGNNDIDLQPLVKGNSLIQCLENIIDQVDNLAGICVTMIDEQQKMNLALSSHFHNSPFFAAPTTPSITLQAAATNAILDNFELMATDLVNLKMNLGLIKTMHLKQFGSNVVVSRYNKTN